MAGCKSFANFDSEFSPDIITSALVEANVHLDPFTFSLTDYYGRNEPFRVAFSTRRRPFARPIRITLDSFRSLSTRSIATMSMNYNFHQTKKRR